jgi:lipopolysaccharide/colanic/teichoic acid biosynthesis glycosyltransferase
LIWFVLFIWFLWSIWSVWSIWFIELVLFNRVNETDQTNQIDQMNQRGGIMMTSCVKRERGVAPQPIFDEELFRDTVRRERKRTERSGLAMVMLSIGIQDSRRENTSALFAGIADALSVIKSDIDILGWFERESIMGLIVPEIDTANLASTCERLECEFQKEITNRFEGDLTERMLIRLSVYPEPRQLGEEELQTVDPFLYPELHAHQDRIAMFQVLKRGMDILGSLALLIILSPLLLTIAGLVKLSSRGPVLFRQVRMGQMLKPFLICKFRTMNADADHGIHHSYVSWFINSSGKIQDKEENTIFKMTNDPRITPIGYFLRKTSIDELPQLWNVLRGEMSLVGPRPPLWYEVQQYKPWHRHRVLGVKPGITGLWQVTGRSRTTFDEMVRLDLRYARGQSLWADIKILLATPAAVIKGKGAC